MRERIGKLPPRYTFALNPYIDERYTKCPKCRRPTFLRKFPLLIHVDGFGPLVLSKTCRYCARCEIVILHKNELEPLLVATFTERDPKVIGNKYFVIGTVHRKTWQKGMAQNALTEEVLEHTADFKRYVTLTPQRPRWVYVGKKK